MPNLFGRSDVPTMPDVLRPSAADYDYRNLAAASGPNPIWGGIKAGFAEAPGYLGSAAAALGKATGWEALERGGQAVAEQQFAEAQRVGRPDLEGPVFGAGWSGVVPRLSYQFGKAIPTLGAIAATAPLMPEIGILSAAGRMAPRILGGGGLGLGEAATADAAATAAAKGAGWGKNVLAGMVATAPQNIASAYEQARAAPGGATPGTAAAALGLGVLESPLSAIALNPAGAWLGRGGTADLFSKGGAIRVGTAGAANAAAGAVQGGVSTAANLTLRPDIPVGEKMSQVVDATLSGAAVGGLMGGVFGLRKENPTNVTNEQLAKVADDATGRAPPLEAAAPAAPPTEPVSAAPVPALDPVAEMQAILRKQSGAEQRPEHPIHEFISGIEAKSPAEARNAIELKFESMMPESGSGWKEKPSAPLKALGVEYGLLDPKDPTMFRDLKGDRATAFEALDDLETKAEKDPGFEARNRAKIETAKGVLAEADAAIKLHDEAKQLKAAPEEMIEKPPKASLRAMTPEEEAAGKAMPPEEEAGIPQERPDAVPEPGPEGILLRKAAEAGPGVGEAYSERDVAGAQAEREIRPPVTQEEGVRTAEQVLTDEVPARPVSKLEQTFGPEMAEKFRNIDPDALGLQAKSVGVRAMLQTRTPVMADRLATIPPERLAAKEALVAKHIDSHLAEKQAAVDTPKARYPDGIPARPLSDAVFERTFQQATKNLSPEAAARIHVVNTAADLPPELVKTTVEDGGRINDAKGLHWRGESYIVKDRHTNPADFQETIAHEVIHDAMQRTLGDRYHSVTQSLFDMAGGADGLLRIADRFGVGDQLRKYVPVGPELSLADKSDLADEMLAQVGGRAGGKMKTALMAWVSDMKPPFLKVLRAVGLNAYAARIDRFGPLETAAAIRDLRNTVSPGAIDPARASSIEHEVRYRDSVPGAVDTMKRVGDYADRILAATGDKLLLFRAIDGIARATREYMPTVTTFYDTLKMRDNVGDQMTRLFAGVAEPAKRWARENVKNADMLNQVMQAHAEFRMNLGKTWGENTWLHDRPELKPEFDRMQGIFNSDAFRRAGGRQMFDRLVAVSDLESFAPMSALMHEYISGLYPDDRIAGFEQNPGAVFARNGHSDPVVARDFWKADVAKKLVGIERYLNDQRGEAALGGSEAKAIKERIAPLEQMAADIAERAANREMVPYFHLGRFGDQMLSMHFKTLADGKTPDPQAIARIQELFAKAKMGDVSLNAAGSAKFFARFESKEQVHTAGKIVGQLMKEGLLDPNEKVLLGPNTEPNLMADMGPGWMQKLHQRIDQNDAFSPPEGATAAEKEIYTKAKTVIQQDLHAMLLDMLPDNAYQKVELQKMGVQGYNKDMLRNFAFRAQVGANAFAHITSRADVHAAMNAMSREAIAAKDVSLGIDPAKVITMSNVVTEMARRQQVSSQVSRTFFDTARAINHSYWLGFSPAYMVTVFSQVPVLAWPELASKYGHLPAAQALAKTTAKAFKIAYAMSVGDHDVVTPEMLVKKGVSPKDAALTMDLLNNNSITSGFSQAMAHDVRGSVDEIRAKWLRWANATGAYAELAGRLNVGLAARDLHAGSPAKARMSADDYVQNTIRESMFDFQSWNNARAVGKMGVLGPASPISFSFTGFQTKFIEKFIYEVDRAIRAKDPQDRTEARRFLGAHFAAAMVMGGSLGLPAAGWLAGAATRASALLSPTGEEYDVERGWRDLLANVGGGAGMGEILARGLPRYLGTDMAKYSDQDLAPFSRFMMDRSKMEDNLKTQAMHTLGAPTSMALNLFTGSRDFMMGNYIQGLREMAPKFLKDTIDAFSMSEYGPSGKRAYHDKDGREIPLTPSALNILQKALGFTPGTKAEYDEDKRGLDAEKRASQFVKANIRKNLAISMERGDIEGQRKFGTLAEQHDELHPDDSIMAGFGGYYRRRQQQAVIAKNLDLPFGVSPRDLAARRASSMYNWAGAQ